MNTVGATETSAQDVTQTQMHLIQPFITDNTTQQISKQRWSLSESSLLRSTNMPGTLHMCTKMMSLPTYMFEMWLLRMQTTWLSTGGHEEPVHSTKPSIQHHAQLRLHSSTQTICCSQRFIWQRFLTKQDDVRPFLRSYTSSASQEIVRSFWKRFIAAFTTVFQWSLCSAR